MTDPTHLDQGAHVTGCPHCRVLFPGLDPCPRCGGVAAFRPARMLDPAGIAREVERAAAVFRDRPTRTSLDDLLHVLFLYAPAALDALDRLGSPTLESLRRWDATLHPDVRGCTETEVLASLGEPARRAGGSWIYHGPGPANHVRYDTVLRFAGGRVVEQREEPVDVPCDHDVRP